MRGGQTPDPLSLSEGVSLLTTSARVRGQPPDHLKLTPERLFRDPLTVYNSINSQALHETALALTQPQHMTKNVLFLLAAMHTV